MVKAILATVLLLVSVASSGQGSTDSKDNAGYPKSSFSTDQSDLWWNPSESGWGMQLVQQDSLIFATLFIYGTDGRPTWVVAQLNSVGPLTWSGPLYVTSGPWFGGPFNPNTVGVRQAGTLTFSAPLVVSGTVNYSIDGMSVTKQVQRQTLTNDNYNGAYFVGVNLTSSGCFNSSANRSGTGGMAMSVSQQGTSMAMRWDFQDGTVCTYNGSYSQAGRMGRFNGNYSCSDGEVGTMTLFEMTNRIGMMSGRLNGQGSNTGCRYTGRFTGLDPNKP